MTAAALAEVLDEASLVRLGASPTTPPETLAALANQVRAEFDSTEAVAS